MFKPNRVLGAALVAFALLGSRTAHADTEKAVNLMVKPRVGHTTRSKSVVKMTVMGRDLVITELEKDVVKEVKVNGDVVYENIHEGGTVSANGTETDQPASPTRTKTYDKFGKLKDYKNEDNSGFTTPEVSALMESITTWILTDKPVKTNDTWETELENPVVKDKKVVVKSTYLGVEKVDGKDFWKLKQSTEAASDAEGGKIVYDCTEWVDPANGDTFKFEGTVKNLPTQFGPLTIHITTQALKADAKNKAEAAKPIKNPN